MTFPVITTAVTDQFVSALCNTLVHSLWQGLLLSAVGGLIIVATKKASSALRYNLLIAAMVLFTAGVGVTFAIQFQQAQPVAFTGGNVVHTAKTNVIMQAAVIPNQVANLNITQKVYANLNKYHNTIVLIWFLIICAKSIQFGAGLYGTYRLKHRNAVTVGSFWNERMKQLAAMMSIAPAVSLLESGMAKVPMVIGHLKPVILVPIGLLTALSSEEVEAILIHELAHIKRRDYLVNLLQSLMEIVFFFNPAVLWISQLIKTERENCCDDMALEQSSNKISYIRALVSCEEYQAAIPAYAMAFPGGKSSLLDRVKRMAGNGNHSLNIYEKTALAICLVASGLCMSAFAAKENIKHVVHAVEKVFHHTEINKVEEHKLIEQTTLLKQQTTLLNQVIAKLSDTANQSAPDTNKLKAFAPMQPINMAIAPMVTMTPINMNVKPMVTMIPLKVSMGKLQPMVALAPMQISLDIDTNKKKVKTKVTTVVKDSVNVQVNTTVNSNVNAAYSYSTGNGNSASSNKSYNSSSYSSSSPASASSSSHTLGKGYSNYSIVYSPATKSYKADSNKAYSKAKYAPAAPSTDIGEELLKAKLIKDKNHFDMKLNNDELIIDGIKQSEENHQIFLKKYQKKPGDKVNMSMSVNQTKDAFNNRLNLYSLFIPEHC